MKDILAIAALVLGLVSAAWVASGDIGYRRGFCARHFVVMTDDRGVTYHIDTQTGDDRIQCDIEK